MPVKLTVSLSEQVVDALKELADEQGTSVTEQLRRAVALQKWVSDTRSQGGRVLVEDPTGGTRELVFLG